MDNQIRIPKSFKLYGQTIHVIFDESLALNKDCFGLAKFDDNIIVLQPDTPGCPRDSTQIEQTFLHEVIHFILVFSSYSEDNANEKKVDVIGRCLHQILQTSFYNSSYDNLVHKKKKDKKVETE